MPQKRDTGRSGQSGNSSKRRGSSKPYKTDLGTCPYCGENLYENKSGWGCSGFKAGCRAFIFKNDHFFEKVLGMKMNRTTALKLIMGGQVIYYDIVVKGKKRNVRISWGKQPPGSRYEFGYKMEFLDDNGNVIFAPDNTQEANPESTE